MCRRIAPLLTIACVFTHALLGCCWHHAHGDFHTGRHGDMSACDGVHQSTHVADRDVTAHHDGHGCSHDDVARQLDGSKDTPHTPQEPAHPCEEPDCQFVASVSNDILPSLRPVPAAGPLAVLPVRSALRDEFLVSHVCEVQTSRLSETAGRARTQVWLI